MDITSGLRRYHLAHLTGVPPRDTDDDVELSVMLFPTTHSDKNMGGLPIPSFLVPAVLEALVKSEQYRDITRVVPGEADSYCAAHAKLHGGLIITSDSDLLVHELGSAGSVAFFPDLEQKDDPQSGQHQLCVVEYRSREIRSKLSLTDDCGMLDLAFELSMDTHLTFKQALKRAKLGTAKAAMPSEYANFEVQYKQPDSTSYQGRNDLDCMNLDPRISELVLQAVKHAATSESPSDCTAYLPLLTDLPSRKSAWEASSRVRQVAYGLLHLLDDVHVSDVIEVRRLQGMSGGTRVPVPPLSLLEAACFDLHQSLLILRGAIADQDLRWLMLSVYLDIIDTHEQGKDGCLSLQIFRLQTRGVVDPTSWEYLHFLAQYQGTLYSLRMMLQIMTFTFSKVSEELPSALLNLRKELSELPTLDKFPKGCELVHLLSHVCETGGLSRIAELFELPSFASTQIASMSLKSARAGRARRSRQGLNSGPPKATSNNIFTALADSQE